MDNSCIFVDSSQFKSRISDLIEDTRKVLDKRAVNIAKELNRMREENEIIIGRFLKFCEMNNLVIETEKRNSSLAGKQQPSEKEMLIISESQSKNNDINKISFEKVKNVKVKQYYNNLRGSPCPTKKRFIAKEMQQNHSVVNFNGTNQCVRSKSPSSSKIGTSPSFPKLPTQGNINNNKQNLNNSAITSSVNNNKVCPMNQPGKRNHTPKSDLRNWIRQNSINNETGNSKEKTTIDNSVATTGKDISDRSTALRNNSSHPSENSLIEISAKEDKSQFMQAKVKKTNHHHNGSDSTNGSLHDRGSRTIEVSSNNLHIIEDQRKFSILDIGGSIGLPNDSEISQAIKAQKNFKKMSNKPLDLTLKTKMLKAMYILAKSNILPLRCRIICASSNKIIKNIYPIKEIIKDYSTLLEENIFNTESALIVYEAKINSELLKNFKPSKTAQNGLNFISKQDEESLLKIHEQIVDSEELETIFDIFRFIYTLIRHKFDKVEPKLLIQNLFLRILPKLKVDSLKSLFLNVISNSLILSPDYLTLANSIADKNENIFNPSYVLKINRPVSYLTFILKEIYDYINLKSQDGSLIMSFRKKSYDLKKMKAKLIKFKMNNQ